MVPDRTHNEQTEQTTTMLVLIGRGRGLTSSCLIVTWLGLDTGREREELASAIAGNSQ